MRWILKDDIKIEDILCVVLIDFVSVIDVI